MEVVLVEVHRRMFMNSISDYMGSVGNFLLSWSIGELGHVSSISVLSTIIKNTVYQV